MASAIRWRSAAARSAHRAGYAHRAGSTTYHLALAPCVSPSPQPFQAAGRAPQRSSSMSHMCVHASPSAAGSTSPTATTQAPTVTHLQQEQQEQHQQKEQRQDQQGPQQQQLPATYRRLVAKGCGRSFREVATLTPPLPLPTPGPKEVLLRMRYAGINGGCETFRARGEFWFSPNRDLAEGFPLGAEGCGEVVALGPDCGGALHVGQAVAVTTCSSFSEYCVAKAAMCTPLEGPASAEAAALAISGLTAAAALEGTAKLQPGESVAVTAAAGGTGHFAVQLALINGASKVIAIVGDDAKVAALEALDPSRVQGLNRKDPDFERRLEAAVPPGGVDVVYEGVGGRLQQLLLQHLAPAGRLLQVGYISEYPHAQGYPDSQQGQQAAAQQPQQPQQDEHQQLPPCAQLFWDRLTVTRGDQRIFGMVWPSDPKAIARCKRRVFQLHREGRLQAWVDRSAHFKGLDSIPDAVEHMLRGGHMGKVVVEI